ncbi:reverse transcriptase domain-containing protein, partial [Tanacetum coccineum]
MNISSTEEDKISWFANFANYLVGKILRKGLTYAQRCKFFSELKHYFWDEPYLFKMCLDEMIRRCVYGAETRKILEECHHGPTGGHYAPSTTTKKFFDAGFYWTTIFKEAHTLLFFRFGIPKALISDRGTHFCNRQMEKVLKRYGVHHRFATTYHPQTSGQVENSNKALKRILEKNREKLFLQFHELDELRLQAYENSKLYKARTKAYHDRKLRIRKEFKAGDKVLLNNSKYKFKAPKHRSKWYGPSVVKHGFSSGFVELYDKHVGSFIVNGHRVKLYHDEEQINKLTTEEIYLMCKQGKMKVIPFMAPFLADYRETMPWVTEKPFIYNVVENTCNEVMLYDLDETNEGIVKGNFLYVKMDP